MFTALNGIFNGILTREQREQGFTLTELYDGRLALLRDNKPVAHFLAVKVTVEEIWKAADEEIAKQQN